MGKGTMGGVRLRTIEYRNTGEPVALFRRIILKIFRMFSKLEGSWLQVGGWALGEGFWEGAGE